MFKDQIIQVSLIKDTKEPGKRFQLTEYRLEPTKEGLNYVCFELDCARNSWKVGYREKARLITEVWIFLTNKRPNSYPKAGESTYSRKVTFQG